MPQVALAWLFPQETPWHPIELSVRSMEELVAAAAGHGQTVAG
jgi:hypothetical protein